MQPRNQSHGGERLALTSHMHCPIATKQLQATAVEQWQDRLEDKAGDPYTMLGRQLLFRQDVTGAKH